MGVKTVNPSVQGLTGNGLEHLSKTIAGVGQLFKTAKADILRLTEENQSLKQQIAIERQCRETAIEEVKQQIQQLLKK